MTYQEFLKRALTIVALLLFVASIWFLRSIWTWGFMSVVVAVGISIPAQWLQKRGWKRILALLVSVVGVGAAIIFLALWMVPTLVEEMGSLITQIPAAATSIAEQYEDWRMGSERLRDVLPPITELGATDTIATGQLSDILNSESLLPVVQGVGSAFSIIFDIAIMLFIAIFFLIDPQSYVKGSMMLLPRTYHDRARAIWNELYRTLRAYISALSISIVITVLLVWFVLGVLLDVPNANVIAAFAGIATFIPNIGAFIPLIPIVVFTIAVSPSLTLIAIVAYLAIQLTEGNVLTPAIVKSELNIPAGLLMLFQLTATLLFGTLGLLLAVPLLAVIMALVRELYSYDYLGLNEDIVEDVETSETAVKRQGVLVTASAPPPPSEDVNKATEQN